jgi:large subunit ribosomal protein L23
MELTEIIRHGIVTEKSVNLQQQNKYTFRVAIDANKVQIRQAVEALFKVKVLDVRTMHMHGKQKTIRSRNAPPRAVAARPWKKAIVTLAEGDSIPELQA